MLPTEAAHKDLEKAKQLFGAFSEKSALLYAAHMSANTADHLAIHTYILCTCTLHNVMYFQN